MRAAVGHISDIERHRTNKSIVKQCGVEEKLTTRKSVAAFGAVVAIVVGYKEIFLIRLKNVTV